MTRQQLITACLSVTAGAFAIGASIFTGDWISCMSHQGGISCREPRNMAAGAWAALATNAMALATNILNDET